MRTFFSLTIERWFLLEESIPDFYTIVWICFFFFFLENISHGQKDMILDHIPSCRVGRKLGVELLLNQMVRIINTFHWESGTIKTNNEMMFLTSSSVSRSKHVLQLFCRLKLSKKSLMNIWKLLTRLTRSAKICNFI